MDNHLIRYQKKNIVFIDCETLNLCLNFCHNLPWQISMLKCLGDKEVDHKDFYIKWNTKLKISDSAARITRYDPKKIEKDGLNIEKVFPTIKDWLMNADYIIGHNILGFDIYIIKELFKYMNEDSSILYPKIIDTNCLARGLKSNLIYKSGDNLLEYQYKVYHTKTKNIRTSLGFLAKEYQIKFDENKLHNAIEDLRVNLEVWNKLKWQVEV